LGPITGEDKKWVLNHLPIALPKYGMGLIFWVMLLEIVLEPAIRKDIDNETSSFSIKTLNIWRKNTTTGAIGTFILL